MLPSNHITDQPSKPTLLFQFHTFTAPFLVGAMSFFCIFFAFISFVAIDPKWEEDPFKHNNILHDVLLYVSKNVLWFIIMPIFLDLIYLAVLFVFFGRFMSFGQKTAKCT